MKQIVAPNFVVAVGENLGKFFKSTTATLQGDVYGIDYQVKYDPERTLSSRKPGFTTIKNFKSKIMRDEVFERLMNYIADTEAKTDFVIK